MPPTRVIDLRDCVWKSWKVELHTMPTNYYVESVLMTKLGHKSYKACRPFKNHIEIYYSACGVGGQDV